LGVLMDETGDGTQGRARKSIPVNIPLPPSATLSIPCCVDAPDFDRLPRHLLLTPFEKRRCPLFRGHIGNLTSQRIGTLAVHGTLLVVGRIPHPSVIGGGKERQIAEAVNSRFPLRARKRLTPIPGLDFRAKYARLTPDRFQDRKTDPIADFRVWSGYI